MFGLKKGSVSARPFDDSRLQQITCRNGQLFNISDETILLEGTTDRGESVMLHIKLDGTQRQALVTYGCQPRG